MEGVIGEIRGFAGNFAPRTWAFCEGQLLAISSHTALFSILGTTYGGDGRSTFALPDLRGRTMIGPGTGPGLTPRALGARGGSETNTLTTLQMPSHTHGSTATVSGTAALPAYADEASTDEAENNYLANVASTDGNTKIYHTASDGATLGHGIVTGTATVTIFNSGGSQPFNNMQPWLGIYYIICLTGIFPSRN